MATTFRKTRPRSARRSVNQELLSLLPEQGYWSVDDYLWLTNRSNHLTEFTDGVIEVLPMPTRRHQDILLFLYEILKAFLQVRGGKVLVAPMRLQLAPERFREPDILVLLDRNDPRNQDAYWLGADLVIEIVSPDDQKRDTVQKRQEYAEAAIPEYWIVNPVKETVTVLTLQGSSYAEHGIFKRGDSATSVLLSGFSADVTAMLDAQ